jgi:hydroxypyruvate reductase
VTALHAAAAAAVERGYSAQTIEAPTAGEAREAAGRFAAEARTRVDAGDRPVCVVAAGETTVTVAGDGLGGRNQEFALAMVPWLVSFSGRAAVFGSAGTDGIDGPTNAAGALADSATAARAAAAGLDWRASLAANDAYRFFEPLGDLLRWGATGTNVGDLHVLLVA